MRRPRGARPAGRALTASQLAGVMSGWTADLAPALPPPLIKDSAAVAPCLSSSAGGGEGGPVCLGGGRGLPQDSPLPIPPTSLSPHILAGPKKSEIVRSTSSNLGKPFPCPCPPLTPRFRLVPQGRHLHRQDTHQAYLFKKSFGEGALGGLVFQLPTSLPGTPAGHSGPHAHTPTSHWGCTQGCGLPWRGRSSQHLAQLLLLSVP